MHGATAPLHPICPFSGWNAWKRGTVVPQTLGISLCRQVGPNIFPSQGIPKLKNQHCLPPRSTSLPQRISCPVYPYLQNPFTGRQAMGGWCWYELISILTTLTTTFHHILHHLHSTIHHHQHLIHHSFGNQQLIHTLLLALH